MKRRQFSLLAASACLPFAAFGQTGAPLRLLVPFPPGGATDLTARLLTEPLGRLLGRPVVVENRSGAGGSLGMTELARARPDGSVFGLATVSTHGVNPAVYKRLPYDPIKDFAAVTEIVRAPGVLVVNPSVKASNVPEFIRFLKANPDKLAYASAGNGTISHMWGELFKSTTSTAMMHVPYRGAGHAQNDLMAGQVQVYFDQLASSLPHIQSGRVKALAVAWNARLPFLPDVPTFGEHSLFSNNDASWFGLVAPAGTPRPEVERMQRAVAQALREPGMAERLEKLGLFASGSTPEEFDVTIRKEIDKMRRISSFARIALD